MQPPSGQSQVDIPQYNLSDLCKMCQHSYELHVSDLQGMSNEDLDKTVCVVSDMENLLIQMKNERDDQDTKKMYVHLFQFLKRHMLTPKIPSLAGENLGTPPFEKPTIAKVSVVYELLGNLVIHHIGLTFLRMDFE